MVALDSSNSSSSYTDLDYAIYGRSNKIEIYESGALVCSGSCGFSSYSTSDVFTIQRVGSTIEYLRNGNVFYTHSGNVTEPLHVDTSFLINNGTINNAETLGFSDTELLHSSHEPKTGSEL